MQALKNYLANFLHLDLYREYLTRFRADKVVVTQCGETTHADGRTSIFYSRIHK